MTHQQVISKHQAPKDSFGVSHPSLAAPGMTLPGFQRTGSNLITFTGPSTALTHQGPAPEWHAPVFAALERWYDTRGFGYRMLVNDFGLLKRACGSKHPCEVTTADLENVVLSAAKASSRATYISRFRTVFEALRTLGIVDEKHRPDDPLPKLRRPRSMPRPITKAQAEYLMNHTSDPVREWFILGCLAGLRAAEVSNLEGAWLEQHSDGPMLRILGKGKTDLTIPAHPKVVEVVESHRTLGRLYRERSTKVSNLAGAAMRAAGINNTFHACRHFFATELLDVSGGDLLLVSELMRHSNLNTTRGYAQLKQGRKREVLARVLEGGESAHAGLASA